jgi:hypothetical protein
VVLVVLVVLLVVLVMEVVMVVTVVATGEVVVGAPDLTDSLAGELEALSGLFTQEPHGSFHPQILVICDETIYTD